MTKVAPKTFKFYVKEPAQKQVIIRADDVWRRFRRLKKADQESAWIIGLDTKNKVIFCDMLFLGGIKASNVDPIIVFKRLLTVGATSFIFIHNHPSGNPEPSKEDIATTEKLKRGADILGLELVDSIIIGDSYFSFKGKYLL